MLEVNKIYNQDCLQGLKLIRDESIDLIVTDPPYKTTARGSAGNSGGMCKTELFNKGKVFNNNDIDMKAYIPELYRVLKQNTHFYIMTNHVNLHEMLDICTQSGFKFVKSLIWNKGNKIMGQFYMNQFEYILFFRKGGARKINNCGTSDIISVPNKKQKDDNGKNLHDTEKPVELMKILIENSTNEGELVLDPFMGIGATAVACKQSNRNFIGFELDENYHAVANNRIGGA